MLDADTTERVTGHPVGGVCPFGLAKPLPVYCDRSLEAFATVFPAAGSRTASVELAPATLAAITGAEWVDVCVVPGVD
jgi:prolyl-tRNA editing enzyme YbaK/EbsC (Cys-tRNA(Pro) deacylase)